MKKKLAVFLVLVFALSLCAAGCGNSGKVTINVLNWGDYIDEDLLDQFTEETGIEVNYQTMATNEEMLVKLEASDCIYDVCFPSDYVIEKLIEKDLLHELNKENIPNLANIDERFLDLSFDPENKYSVPYMWGTVGILYNTTMVDEPVTSWDILWDEKYGQQIFMYDSIRDTIGVALLKLGLSINTRDEADIKAAETALIEQKPLVLAYLGDNIKESMINGDGALAVVYSGDAMWCIDPEEGNPDLDYAVPESGSNLWFDNVIIPKSSQPKRSSTSCAMQKLPKPTRNTSVIPPPTRPRSPCLMKATPRTPSTTRRKSCLTSARSSMILATSSTFTTTPGITSKGNKHP